jgi:hypothetical protein
MIVNSKFQNPNSKIKTEVYFKWVAEKKGTARRSRLTRGKNTEGK